VTKQIVTRLTNLIVISFFISTNETVNDHIKTQSTYI